MKAAYSQMAGIHVRIASFIYKNTALTFVWLSQGPLSIYINIGVPGKTPRNRELGCRFYDRNNVFGIILNLKIVQCQKRWIAKYN